MISIIKNKNSFPLFKSLFSSFGIFFENLSLCVKISSFFALIFMLLNFVCGQSFFCYNINLKEHVFCTRNLLLFIASSSVLGLIVSVYIRNWYNIVILKKYKFSIKELLPKKSDIKIYGLLLICFVLILILSTSGFLLVIRDPNPNWMIEVAYFSVVSIGFFAPVLSVPVVSLIPFAAEGLKMPKIREIWQVTKGNLFIMFISLTFITIISFGFLSSSLRYFIQLAKTESIFIVIAAEFLYNIIFLFAVGICTNYSYKQKEFLFERSQND